MGKKVSDTSPKSARSAKTAAATAQKRNDSKERETKVKRSLSKEPEEELLKYIKTEPIDNSYEVTIEEVIASSMLVEAPIKVEGEESVSESDLKGRKLVRNPVAKRSLRNGKLRMLIPKVEPGMCDFFIPTYLRRLIVFSLVGLIEDFSYTEK